MIRIPRGTEPPGLAAARRQRLPVAAAIRTHNTSAAGRRRPKELPFGGYDVARDALYELHKHKCVYCERLAGKEGQPVEHFRPKAEAHRGDVFTKVKRIDRARYWWLAWSWDNLFFACVTCNCANRKGHWFPLAPRSKPLAVPTVPIDEAAAGFDVRREQPMLLDPRHDDPLDHIVWRPLDPAEPVDRMEWRPFHKTERGRWTIHILGLDRGVPDHVGQHIRHNVHPRIQELLGASPTEAKEIWARTVTHLFVPTLPFLAATHDALDFFIPAADRVRLGLILPRPGAHGE